MIRVWLARATSALRWGKPRRAAKLYMAFARAERSSFYDLMAAAELCREPARRARYLAHASDEGRHAQMFTLRATQLDAAVGGDPSEQAADCEQLFARLGEAQFLAFVHLGERRGRRQLAVYRDELARRGDHKGRALLDAVLIDEARHEQYTGEELARVLGSPTAVRKALWRARGWELSRFGLRSGHALGAALFNVCMRALYVLLWPLALLERAGSRRAS